MSSATSGIITDLSTSIMDSDDLKMVEDGAPAYLLMVDSLIAKDPDNENMLANAALLYTAYADIFVADKKRSRKLSEKALSYAVQAMCRADKRTCDLKNMNFDDFETIIKDIEKTDVPVLFALGNSWAAWIMANQSDFDAIADISRIETIMQHILFLDEKYKDGSAYLYLGALATLLPPALGGTPEKGKTYFEKALDISQGKNLMVNVLFAKQYARMMFDRKLHDQLLSQVVKADPRVPGYTLINTHAQRQARELLGSADDYF
ncbi:MAG: hypothetical protein GY729_20610 [Desulfobacteraceae bacterium]|nr:hypothetical protein [Desulfobacteraceae bacterium]